MVSLVAYGAVCGTLVVVLSAYLLWAYARADTAPGVLAVVFVSWLMTFSLSFLLPIDLLPDMNDDMTLIWLVVYWCSFAWTWLVIPFLHGFYTAGEFTPHARAVASLRSNVRFYTIAGALFVVFLVYVSLERRLSVDELLAFAVSLANTWGITLAVLLLGFGLVEVPRALWQSGSRGAAAVRCALERVASLHEEKETAFDALWDSTRRCRALAALCPPDHELAPFMREVESRVPIREHELELATLNAQKSRELAMAAGGPGPVLLTASDLSLRALAELNYSLRSHAEHFALTQAEYDAAVEHTLDLHALAMRHRNGECWPAHERLGEALAWSLRAHVLPIMARTLAVIMAAAALLLVCCELSLAVSPDYSPLALLLRWEPVRTHADAVLVLSLCALSVLLCACLFSLWHVRIAHHYRLSAHRVSSAHSLLMAASYALRVVPPLAFNFVWIAGAHDSGTAFERVVGQPQVVPALGSFHVYAPVLVALFCALTFFRVHTRVLRWLALEPGDGESDAALEDELVAEGRLLVRAERKRRGLPTEAEDDALL